MAQVRIIIVTILSLLAFAANSLITRAALEKTAIDETSFILLRVVSGALFLGLYLAFKKLTFKKLALNKGKVREKAKVKTNIQSGSWLAATALFIYAISFTYGYALIAAGTGALLLFGSVQITMTIVGYREGERLNKTQLVGFILALLGLIILMLPGLQAPSLIGALLMCISGVAWSLYTLQGRGTSDPGAATAFNFIKASPLAILLWVVVNFSTDNVINMDNMGVFYALLSGIVTSGIGYIIWYSVLPELKATQAAIVQLSVPVLVNFAGALLLNEAITIRILIASLTILSGTVLVLKYKENR